MENRIGSNNKQVVRCRKEMLRIVRLFATYVDEYQKNPENVSWEWAKAYIGRFLSKAGFTVSDEIGEFNIMIRMNWILNFKFGESMPAEDLKDEVLAAFNAFIESTPAEFRFENLTPEKLEYLGSEWNEKFDFYSIPCWYLPLVPHGTTFYYVDYAKDETGKVLPGENGDGVEILATTVYDNNTINDLGFESTLDGQLIYGIKF